MSLNELLNEIFIYCSREKIDFEFKNTCKKNSLTYSKKKNKVNICIVDPNSETLITDLNAKFESLKNTIKQFTSE